MRFGRSAADNIVKCAIKEIIDVYNGLLLTPNIDKLLDRGLISFDDDGKILLSSELTNDDMRALALDKDMKMNRVEESHKTYLRYHRKMIFR